MTCTQCGATTPGLRCEWQKNYTQCAPCASLLTCPICLVDYSEGATILQCRQCDRWAPVLQTAARLCARPLTPPPSPPPSGGFTPLARVSTRRKTWKKLQKTASTARCVEPSRALKVWGSYSPARLMCVCVCDARASVLTLPLLCCCSCGQGQRRH